MKLPLNLIDIAARSLAVLNPEQAHDVTINLMAKGLSPKVKINPNPALAINVAGIDFPNPLGLAAGFDKNAKVSGPALDLGFGFVEVGAVTPKPQPGNERPRIFRLREDLAVINRYGFNNEGMNIIGERLRARNRAKGIVGINLGANKESDDRTQDYVTLIAHLAKSVDFYTVNISSPNTPGLRALQDKNALNDLLQRVLKQRDESSPGTALFLKISPDLNDEEKSDIADCIIDLKIDGLIVSNTTLSRPDTLRSEHANEAGGLSGPPLFELSTRVLGELYSVLGNKIPLIGVGGIANTRHAYQKILNGASLVQLYTAMVYHGPSLPSTIIKELPEFLKTDGFDTIEQAVGAKFS